MRIFLGLLLTFILFACNQNNSTKFYWIRFQGREYQKADTTQIIKFNKISNGDTIKYSYQTKSGGFDFFIVKNKDSALIVYNPRDSLVHLNDSIVYTRNFYDTMIIINKDTFKVEEFITDEFVTDGAAIHYFTPAFGLYAGHSNTWAGITYLQSNDTIVNKKINYLIKATVPKFFIRDTLQKILE